MVASAVVAARGAGVGKTGGVLAVLQGDTNAEGLRDPAVPEGVGGGLVADADADADD
ncbi:MAG: hypothetical protein PGN11_04025 [Quadrisphaera sp.]